MSINKGKEIAEGTSRRRDGIGTRLFGKTKVHLQGCVFFGQPEPPGPCTCPLRQAWGSLDALIGRLRAAYEENGGLPETNPFASGAIRIYLREATEVSSTSFPIQQP
ncbi:hypothetical protein GOBAR_DD34621 [Gossypium barbadense]|nr:hypothetical protein GOBAR_DD34621 [Gossypium barbadense]